jgi:hypothetical protein
MTHITYWGVRAHILEEDGETVKTGFALPSLHTSSLIPAAFWEFVRSYMTKGPKNLTKIKYLLPLSKEKETPELAAFKMQPAGSGYSSAVAVIQSFDRFCRWLVNATCKIPVWPKWVEAECLVDIDDPYMVNPDNCPSMSSTLAKEIGHEDETFFYERLLKANIKGTLLDYIEKYPQPSKTNILTKLKRLMGW